MVRRTLLLAALSGALAPLARADDILLFDVNATNRNARAALASLGYPYTISTEANFVSQVGSGTYEVVVLDMPSNTPSGAWQAALSRFITGGGKVVMSYWYFQGDVTLNAAFSCSSALSISTPQNFYKWDTTHAIFTSPNAVPNMTTKSDTWGDDGDELRATGTGTMLAGFSAAYSAARGSIVEANSGRTLYNGFVWDEFTGDEDRDGTRDVVELIANEISYVVTGGCDDLDGDSYTDAACGGTDCDDTNAAISPAATEACNLVDDDCDAAVDEGVGSVYYADADGDRYGNASTVTVSCSAPLGYVTNGSDCDDTRSTVNPLGTEMCNSLDDDCDGVVDDSAADARTWYADADADTYGSLTTSSRACSAPAGYVTSSADCLDTNAAVHPGAAEVCNGLDDDCEGTVDVGAVDSLNWYVDVDADGYGDRATSSRACTAPLGYTADSTDCADADATAYPGATEWCDGVDDDCDGTVDDAAVDASTWYADADGDSYGNIAVSAISCDAPGGYLSDNTDCDDTSAATFPGAYEVPYDGVDQDCVGGDALDVDADGYASTVVGGSDCVDTDASINPAAAEGADGVDSDCDGTVDELTDWSDDDGDGYTEEGGDCDDGDAATHPAAAEAADGADDDCDGLIDEGTEVYDDDADGLSEAAGDCNDGDARQSPRNAEVPANGIDDDCDGVVDVNAPDDDADGYTDAGGDCDEALGTVYPGAPELADGLDNDCDGEVDEGTERADGDGDGVTALDGDCDDTNADIGPERDEVADGLDNNCDGDVDEGTDQFDDDGDGYTEEGGDCDDDLAAVNPGAAEIPNLVDDDCDGAVDDATLDLDGDGYTTEAGDCDDREGWTNPGMTEQCDGLDNNCDGATDEGCEEGDTADSGDTGAGASPPAEDCGCAAAEGSGGAYAFVAWAALAGLAARARRRNGVRV